MEGISNEDIVNFFEEKTDDDLKKNFVGIFPSNYVVKFICFHRMMAEILIAATKAVHIGGVFWIYIQKKKFFYSIASDLKALNSLLCRTIENFSINSV